MERYPLRVAEPSTLDFVRSLVIPDTAAGMWLTLTMTDVADRSVVYTRISDPDWPPVWVEDFDDIADFLCERVTGWFRWEAEHVWRQTLGAWAVIDGDLQAAGVDLLALPPSRATNTAFAWWRRNLGDNAAEWKKWTREMDRKPRRIIIKDADQPMSVAEMASLQALIGGGAGRTPVEATPDSTVTLP